MIDFDLLFLTLRFLSKHIYNNMTTQIDVVEVNDNTVTEEVKEIKPKRPRAKAKVQPKL